MKSNASDFLELMDHVYRDATIKCSADVSDLRDLQTMKARTEHEGISFLTITLPQFCMDFERSLAEGQIDSNRFTLWRKAKGSMIPAFLQGIISRLFSYETGKVIYDEKSPIQMELSVEYSVLVEAVRQICLSFKKVEIACTQGRVDAAIEGFVDVEQSFEAFSLLTSDTLKFTSVSDMLWGDLVSSYEATGCTPRHGPGATADKISGNQKFVWRRWHDRLEPYFPLIDNAYPLGTPESAEELKLVTIVSDTDEQPVRVITVPKTLKSPRIIAIEPCCQQFVQQGIKDFLYESLESYWLTTGHVNFRDQTINQRLAIYASRTGQLATIDLSDASDRVPRELAMEMFRLNQDLTDSIDACRSTRAELPDGRIIDPLRKFASMGSALCFPVEAMYFYTVCVVALLEANGLSVGSRNIFKVTRDLYVYGDDIIVPVTHADIVLDHLRKYNCKVNVNKTFVSGSFRESCGVDAFAGYEVTPTYLRHVRPTNKRQCTEIVSWVETSNLFYKRGYWSTAQFMRNYLERILGRLPYVSETSSVLGRFSYLGYCSVDRWNRDYQRFELRALSPVPVYRTDRLEGYGALAKCFADMKPLAEEAVLVERSLEQSVRRGVVALKHRWAPAQ